MTARLLLVATFLAAAGSLTAAPANASEEQKLIQVLQSDASPAEKDAACARLKIIGTAECVPALARLLPDEQLSHSARYALESMRVGPAARALLDALTNTTALTRVGIINSLGARGEKRAVPTLCGLLQDSNYALAIAAARALGQIGGPGAVQGLQGVVQNSIGPVHDAQMDALLRCGARMLRSGDETRARVLFERLYATEKSDVFRTAAYRGWVQASGNEGPKMMARALTGEAGPAQLASLQLVHEVQARGATKALAGTLNELPPHLKCAVIGGLTQRNDPEAEPAIAALAGSPNTEVRLACIHAIGQLGDASRVPLLAEIAASGSAEEQQAAREALVRLRRGKVPQVLVTQLESSSPAVQGELARALGDRGERTAVPRLLELAEKSSDSARQSAMRALGVLVSNAQLQSLVNVLRRATTDAARKDAAEAIGAACARLRLQGAVNIEPVATALRNGSSPVRLALLPVSSGLPFTEIRIGMRAGLLDPDPKIRDVASRTLCDTVDPELLPELVDLSRHVTDPKLKNLAVAGCVRLTSPEEGPGLSVGQRVDALRAILGTTLTPEQKKRVLAGLSQIPDPQSLALVEPYLADADTQNEAARAAIRITAGLGPAETQHSIALLKKTLGSVSDPATQQALEAAVRDLEASADYITSWQVAGPYRQAGKDYAALFDTPFDAENPDAGWVTWKPLACGTEPKRAFVMDLLKALGGQQCVAYARTWVYSEQAQPAKLEVGSDDGVKIWVNDAVVLAKNVARPLTPASEHVDVNLRKGWNRLLLKITQNTLGWEFCARLLKPDGSHLEGLRYESAPGAEAVSAK